MKRSLFILVLATLTGLAAYSHPGNPAIVVKYGTVFLLTEHEIVPSSSYMHVENHGGSMVLKLTWKLSADNPLVPEKGVYKVIITGCPGQDTKAHVFPDGTVRAIFHVNGSGNITPNPGKDH